mmetsp:Transcript_23576/g.54474  ORF Transcript_23576/g.54474 Transcript_23576/m.54474 type:complete len:239 (-) Transcript_23576:180-896(-)
MAFLLLLVGKSEHISLQLLDCQQDLLLVDGKNSTLNRSQHSGNDATQNDRRDGFVELRPSPAVIGALVLNNVALAVQVPRHEHQDHLNVRTLFTRELVVDEVLQEVIHTLDVSNLLVPCWIIHAEERSHLFELILEVLSHLLVIHLLILRILLPVLVQLHLVRVLVEGEYPSKLLALVSRSIPVLRDCVLDEIVNQRLRIIGINDRQGQPLNKRSTCRKMGDEWHDSRGVRMEEVLKN